MATTPDFGLPLLATQQAAPEVTHNEALYLLQLLLSGVITQTNTPPGSPVVGDCYIIGTAPTGTWAGRANKLATFTAGGWRYLPDVNSSGTPIAIGARHEGLRVYVRDVDATFVWSGTAWARELPPTFVPIIVAASDETTPITAGANKVRFRMPHGYVLTAVKASLNTAQVSGSLFTVDINEAGVSILSTRLTFDNGEATTVTAATQPVISDPNLANDALMSVDVDVVGDGTATGLKVTLIGYRV